MPYPSTLDAVREFRHQGLLEEAAWERCAALAIRPSFSQEGVMFGDGDRDSIIQSGIDEALACRDMLQRAPVAPSLLTRAITWIVSVDPLRRLHAQHSR